MRCGGSALLEQLHSALTLALAAALSFLAGRYGVQLVLVRQMKRAYLRLLLAWARDDAAPPHRHSLRGDDDDELRETEDL